MNLIKMNTVYKKLIETDPPDHNAIHLAQQDCTMAHCFTNSQKYSAKWRWEKE